MYRIKYTNRNWIIIYVGLEFLENVTMHRNVMKFPSDEDLNGAAAALIRLQDTYNLDTASIARGELNGVKYRWEWFEFELNI